jgi:hypothetical protein
VKHFHVHVVRIAETAKALGISKKQLLANWEQSAAEQRAAEKRLKRLKAMAKRRGCELYQLHDDEAGPENDGYDESGDAIIVWWLYVPMANGTGVYPEPVTFDDLDEVEYDLNARPVNASAR